MKLYLNDKGVGTLWAQIKAFFATKQHKHKKADIEDFPESIPFSGGDADTLSTHPLADFLLASGWAGEFAKLFEDNVKWKTVGENITMLNITPGIYEVSKASTRMQLGIPPEAVQSGPPGVDFNEYRNPGGLLIVFGSCFPGKRLLAYQSTYNLTSCQLPFALFIDTNGTIYKAHADITLDTSKTPYHTVLSAMPWRALTYSNYATRYEATKHVYFTADIAVTADTPKLIYSLGGQVPLPYKSASVYGPDAVYSCQVIVGSSGKGVYTRGACTLKAGHYIIELF